MATAASLLSNIRKIFGDPDSDFISDAVGLDWLDRAQRRFCNKVLPLDEIKDYTITAKVNKFDLPTATILPVWLMWYKSSTRKLDYVPPSTWADQEEAWPNATGTPENYTVLRRQVVVGPQVPQTASSNSTASGAITSTGTTLGLVAASGTFRSKGYVKINSEIIEYTGVATTTLTGAVRGVHGTTAASHASADTVTQIDLQMLYRKSPAALATGNSPDIPDTYHEYLEKYALYLAWLARGDSQKAGAALQEFEQLEQDSLRQTGRRALDNALLIQDRKNRVRW